MCDQGQDFRRQEPGEAPASQARKILPVAPPNLGEYTDSAGGEDGQRPREGEARCTGVEDINGLFFDLSKIHKWQLTFLIHLLAASFDEQQKEQYLNQLLKEI